MQREFTQSHRVSSFKNFLVGARVGRPPLEGAWGRLKPLRGRLAHAKPFPLDSRVSLSWHSTVKFSSYL